MIQDGSRLGNHKERNQFPEFKAKLFACQSFNQYASVNVPQMASCKWVLEATSIEGCSVQSYLTFPAPNVNMHGSTVHMHHISIAKVKWPKSRHLLASANFHMHIRKFPVPLATRSTGTSAANKFIRPNSKSVDRGSQVFEVFSRLAYRYKLRGRAGRLDK